MRNSNPLSHRPQALDPGEIPLGHLEQQVMNVIWAAGRSSVREVAQNLHRKLAYTTVMTTLDRLFKKGLLAREKSERAFVYSPRISREQWGRGHAGAFVASFLAGPQPSPELLFSWLMDAVGQHDSDFLDELEERIRARRKALSKRD